MSAPGCGCPGSSVRILSPADLDAIARVHVAAFSRSALTRLGSEAVRRYYHWQFIGPHEAVALGVDIDAALGGFCFAGVFRGALSGFVRQNRAFLAWRIATHPWLVVDSTFRTRLRTGTKAVGLLGRVQAPRFVRDVPSSNAVCAPSTQAVAQRTQRSFGVLSIAVHPSSQGLGLGKALMQVAEEHARARGCDGMHLTVDYANHRAVRFYESLGWTKVLGPKGWSGAMNKLLTQPVDALSGCGLKKGEAKGEA